MNFYRLRGLLVPVVSDLHPGLNTIGRNPTNDVVIHEASVSSFHGEITLDENGAMIRDLQSTNGTFVDDEPVTEREIRSGQVVQFGTVPFRLETEDIQIRIPAPSAPASAPAAPSAPSTAPASDPSSPTPPLSGDILRCSRDPSLPATHRCVKCARVFHYDNLHILRLSGGVAQMLFCPECNGLVEPIPGVDPAHARRPNLLTRLSQTIQLGFKRPK